MLAGYYVCYEIINRYKTEAVRSGHFELQFKKIKFNYKLLHPLRKNGAKSKNHIFCQFL